MGFPTVHERRYYMTTFTQPFTDRRAGRPQLHWTNRDWQAYFEQLRQAVPPVSDPKVRRLPITHLHLKSGEEYHGETAYQSYCSFINDVLTTIRRGGTDYCYFIYQIADLLQFEPELCTRLCCEDRLCPYFEVWLEQEAAHSPLTDRCTIPSNERTVK